MSMPAEVRDSSTSQMQRNLSNPHPHPTTHPAPRLPCCSAQIDCDVPLEEAFALWEDRERIPQWMPWITSVVVQQASWLARAPGQECAHAALKLEAIHPRCWRCHNRFL